MDAPPPMLPPEPLAAADRVDAGGLVPSGVRCYRCGYDLVGLDRSGACPECGLGVADWWPHWDLHRCPPMYRRQVRGEVRRIAWAAGLGGVAAACFGVAAAGDLMASVWSDTLDATVLLLLVGLVALLSAGWPLGAFERRWRRHPDAGRAIAAVPRRTARRGLSIVAGGLGLLALPGAVVANVAPSIGAILGLLGVAVALAGAATFFVSGMLFARLVLARIGRPAPTFCREWAWALASVLSLVPVMLALAGIASWSFAAAAGLLGVAAAMLALAARCVRASAALARV